MSKYVNSTTREALQAMREDPKALIQIGTRVVDALLKGDRAESYFLPPKKVRTREVLCGDEHDVKGGE